MAGGTRGDDFTRTREVTAIPPGPREAHLEVLSGCDPPRRIPLDGNSIVIGRSREADILLDAEGVSRKHARITRSGRQSLSIVDLGAKNGTFLNGERIDVAALHHGDRIQIGPVALAFVLTETEPTQAAVPNPSPLSAREWEVAQAVARGLTNAEIAKQLGVSRRTVATHLERIFERLDIHSRAALASFVARHG